MKNEKIVKYITQGKRNGKWELIGSSDTRPKHSAETERFYFNDSLKKGGVNEHLGIKYSVSDCRIINQINGKVIDEYKAPMFEVI